MLRHEASGDFEGGDRELVREGTAEDIGAHADAPQLRDLRGQRPQQVHPVLALGRAEGGHEPEDGDMADHADAPVFA